MINALHRKSYTLEYIGIDFQVNLLLMGHTA